MGRTKQIATKSTGGKAPRKMLKGIVSQEHGDIELSASEFMDIFKHTFSVHEDIPEPYLFKELSVSGHTDAKRAVVDLTVVVDVLSAQYPSCRLIPASVTLHDSKITAVDRVTQENVEVDSHLAVIGGYLTLIAPQPALYTVKLHLYIPYTSDQRTDVVMNIPETPLNHLTFKVNTGNSIAVEPLVGELQTKENEEDGYTEVCCEFPATNRLSLQWVKKVETAGNTEQDHIEEEEEEVQPRTITVQQNTIHSIGEGVVRTKCELQFHVLHGTISSTEVELRNFNRKITVISATGQHRSVKKWDVMDSENNVDESAVEHPSRVLIIHFNQEMEGYFKVLIVTELDMMSTSCSVMVPALSVNGVDRETGDIAIEARTDVEIKELDRNYIQRIDVDELSTVVSHLAEFKILLAYRFIEGGYLIKLDVTKHNDVSVLVACVSQAVYEVTRSEDGIMHRIRMTTENTHKQYLRIKLPGNSEIWSTTVAGSSVKPAQDATTGFVLVPFRTDSIFTTESTTKQVEIVFVVTAPVLDNSGIVHIDFPEFDIPVHQLFISITLPEEYRFGEFSGSLEEVSSFSKTMEPPSCIPPELASIPKAETVLKTASAGTKPVSVGHLTAKGHIFKFERLLLLPREKMYLKVPYRRTHKGFLKRRHITDWRPFLVVGAMILGGVSIAWWRMRQ